jgi:hypothetical protein
MSTVENLTKTHASRCGRSAISLVGRVQLPFGSWRDLVTERSATTSRSWWNTSTTAKSAGC